MNSCLLLIASPHASRSFKNIIFFIFFLVCFVSFLDSTILKSLHPKLHKHPTVTYEACDNISSKPFSFLLLLLCFHLSESLRVIMINPLLSIQNSPTTFLKPPFLFFNTKLQQLQEKQNKSNTLFIVETKSKRATTFACLSISRKRRNSGVSESEETVRYEQMGGGGISVLCGLGYWVQGSRCFPWLALNFHMVDTLGLQPSTLQLVQYSCLLPMVAKPLYGVLSDVLYIGSGRRVPYISIGG